MPTKKEIYDNYTGELSFMEFFDDEDDIRHGGDAILDGVLAHFQLVNNEHDNMIPHFHILFEDGRETSIMLYEAKYFHKNSYIMNDKEINDAISYLSSINGKLSIWENLDFSWAMCHNNYEETITQPDYSLLRKGGK